MPFQISGNLRFYTFDSLNRVGVRHALFTRRGGVSPEPWASLNMGGTVGDESDRVAENRRLALASLGFTPEAVFDVWQVHSADVVCTNAPRPANVDHQRADAILTGNPDVALMMRFADCVPVLLYDPQQRVGGMAHAGWQGTVRRTAAAAVASMQEQYGSRPEELLAGIGPSIGAHHYEVGPDVISRVQEAFGDDASALLHKEGSAVQFDLWAANRLVLEQAGVRQIELAGLCTACHPEDWYSHRGERGRTGRFGALMAV